MKSITRSLLAAAVLAAPLASLAAPHLVPLGDDRFKGIEAGESQQQVRDALGAPVSTPVVKGETHYVYNYVDTWGMRSVFDVSFDSNGRVDGKSQLRTSY